MSKLRIRSIAFTIACASLCLFASFVHAAARPIPEIVNVKTFANVEANRLELLVRIPLAAVKDVQLPTRADGDTLDRDALRSMLPGIAKYWIAEKIAIFDASMPLAAPQVADTRISVSGDRSFDTYASALAHFSASDLKADEELFWRQVWLDIRFIVPLPGEAHRIAIHPHLADLGVRVTGELVYVNAGVEVRRFAFDGNHEKIYLDPSRMDTAKQFFAWGGRAIVSSADFLLGLFCLALPFRRYRDLVPSVLTFGGMFVAALVAMQLHLIPMAVWFKPLIDLLVALAILLAAFANIAGAVTIRRRALYAMAVGAACGLSAALQLQNYEQYAAENSSTAATAFVVGSLLALLLVNAVSVPIMTALFSIARVEKVERIIVSALAADTAWFWLSERANVIAKIPLQINWDAETLSMMLRILALLTAMVGVMWFVNLRLRRYDAITLEPTRATGLVK